MDLISPSEMEALRRIPLMGMQTPVSILKYSAIQRDGADDQMVWLETETVNGWIWEPPDYPAGGVVGGVIADAPSFRVYLPVGVSVDVGDRIGADGVIYNVMNTNIANTFMPMLRLAVRRAE